MTPLETLLELLARVGTSRDATVLVSDAELSDWPKSALQSLETQNLLKRASPAATVVCPGCEWQCTMQVETVSDEKGKSASFVVCDKPVGINRVSVSAAQLTQWRCSTDAVGAFVAESLGLRLKSQRKARTGLWELGVARGKKRDQMLCLRVCGDLQIAAGNNTVPLAEVVQHGPLGYSADRERIARLVDCSTTGDSCYVPSTVRREARKLETQDRYESCERASSPLTKDARL